MMIRVTVQQIICDLKGVSNSTKTLFEAYEYHITNIEKLSGVVYTASTVKNINIHLIVYRDIPKIKID